MNTKRLCSWLIGCASMALVALFGWPVVASAQAPEPPPPSANVSVYATGLNNPRGLKFGPDGVLYVAEGGTGGTESTEGQCEQVVPPVGPYTGSATGARVVKIDASGTVTTAVDNLPSSQTSPDLGGLISGAADIAWSGGDLYVLLAGGGCSHGVADVPNALVKANADGTWEAVADLGAYVLSNSTAITNAGDYEPEGSWYGMISVDNNLYALEPNHGELDMISPSGEITRVIDISASQGHAVPTTIVQGRDGYFYVSNLGTFPVQHGAQKIYRIAPDGSSISVYATGLTSVLGLAFDDQNQLYALETSAQPTEGPLPFVPGSGRVVRVLPNGALQEIAGGLMLPTGITFGPDGMLYVSNCGYGCPAGAGSVVKIAIPQMLDVPSGAITFGIVGTSPAGNSAEQAAYGYLASISGLDDLTFSDDLHDAGSARFTFVSSLAASQSISNGAFMLAPSAGTITIYYSPEGADPANPASFSAGTPVVVMDARELAIIDTAMGGFMSAGIDTVTQAAPVQVGDTWVQLAHVGDMYRSDVTGRFGETGALSFAGYVYSLGAQP